MTCEKATILDLFCGAGGLAQGFVRTGFDVTGVDISEYAGKTYRWNLKSNFIKADLSQQLISGKYDIIIGGPPCKPWSSVNLTKRGRNHEDYGLMSNYFQHIDYHSPKMFLLENVPPLAKDKIFIEHVEKLSENYSIMKEVVVYSDYGAPSSRHRLIVFGMKRGNAADFFRKISQYKQPSQAVRDVIWELKYKKRGEVVDHVWPKLKTIEKYRHYYETGKFGWYILDWESPAPSFGNVMKTYILHPDAFNGQPPRVISVKEASLIMGFDKSFCFPDGIGIGLRYQMIVDAVSPIFSYVAARVMKDLFNSEFLRD